MDCAAAWPDSSEPALSAPLSMPSRSLLETWPQLLSCSKLFFASALLLLRTIAQLHFCYMGLWRISLTAPIALGKRQR